MAELDEMTPEGEAEFEAALDAYIQDYERALRGAVSKSLSDADKRSIQRETELIAENKKTYEGKPHDFKSARWTHPNGHPRCLLCGDEEPIGGKCNMPAEFYQRPQDIEAPSTKSVEKIEAAVAASLEKIEQALQPTLSPAPAKKRAVEKTVVRDENGRIAKVIEREID